MIYKQCVIKKGASWQVSGLPEEYAKIGMKLKLRGEDGWVVMSVGDIVNPFSDATIRKHRESTGDSISK